MKLFGFVITRGVHLLNSKLAKATQVDAHDRIDDLQRRISSLEKYLGVCYAPYHRVDVTLHEKIGGDCQTLNPAPLGTNV